MTQYGVHIIDTPRWVTAATWSPTARSRVVVDPQRDIDRVLDLAADSGVRITARRWRPTSTTTTSPAASSWRAVTGATYVLPDGMGVEYDRTRRSATATVRASGDCGSQVLHTPGPHPPPRRLRRRRSGDGAASRPCLTGGSMLFGSTGRTDLVGPEHTDELTHAQYRSVRRLAAELPADTEVLPTHGFGSFCSATPTSGDASTVGRAARDQPGADPGRAGLRRHAARRAGRLPRLLRAHGPDQPAAARRRSTCPRPSRSTPAELRRRLEAGEWVVDLRDRTAFAAGHLAGIAGFELSHQLRHLPRLALPWGTPLTLIGETPEQVADARRELVRIGIDAPRRRRHRRHRRPGRRPAAAVLPGLGLRRPGRPPRQAAARRAGARARRPPRRRTRQGHVAGSQHIPLHELPARLDEVPDGEVWVYCGSGYRASIAASVLDTDGRSVVLINDDYDAAADAGLECTP